MPIFRHVYHITVLNKYKFRFATISEYINKIKCDVPLVIILFYDASKKTSYIELGGCHWIKISNFKNKLQSHIFGRQEKTCVRFSSMTQNIIVSLVDGYKKMTCWKLHPCIHLKNKKKEEILSNLEVQNLRLWT